MADWVERWAMRLMEHEVEDVHQKNFRIAMAFGSQESRIKNQERLQLYSPPFSRKSPTGTTPAPTSTNLYNRPAESQYFMKQTGQPIKARSMVIKLASRRPSSILEPA